MDQSIYGWWLPPDVSVHGAGIDHLISVLHYFMAVLFVGWGLFFAYTLIRFRKREGHAATYEPIAGSLSKYLEIAVAIFEVFVLLGLSMPVWASYKNDPPSEAEALRVRVTAQQFVWNFHYAGPDGEFGRVDISLVKRLNPLGRDFDDPAGKDDVVSVGIFHFPVNKPVVAEVLSLDVIHSFNIPALRVKQDAIPGINVPVWFEAKETGRFELACAQLCGSGHYRMGAKVFIDTAEQYQAWIAEKVKEAQE